MSMKISTSLLRNEIMLFERITMFSTYEMKHTSKHGGELEFTASSVCSHGPYNDNIHGIATTTIKERIMINKLVVLSHLYF